MNFKISITSFFILLLFQACRTNCYFSQTTAPKNIAIQGDGEGYSERFDDSIFYFFNCNEYSFIFRLPLPCNFDSMQSQYEHLDHTHGRFIEQVGEDPFIELVVLTAAQIKRAAEKYNICALQLALAFTQSLAYQEGMGTYHRLPSETLINARGDCSDTAALFSTIACAMGREVIFIAFEEHLMAGVWCPSSQTGRYFLHNGKRYYTCETVEISPIGFCRDEYKDAPAQIIDFCS